MSIWGAVMKAKLFYERIHKATISGPYLDPDMTNLNYLSHFHEELEAIYVLDGKVTIGIDKQVYELCEGDIAFIMPGEVHYYTSVSYNHVYIMKFSLLQEKEPFDFSQIHLTSPVIHKSRNDSNYNKLSDIIMNIFTENNEKRLGYKTSIKASILELSVIIMRKLDYKTVSLEEKKKNTQRLKVFLEVMEYVEENYKQPIALNNAASAVGFSVYYFAHYFKTCAGVSFWDYLCSYRVEKVKALLAVSNDKITDIAFSCGFNSIKTFNRVFKKYCGLSPVNYKKQYLTNNKQ